MNNIYNIKKIMKYKNKVLKINFRNKKTQYLIMQPKKLKILKANSKKKSNNYKKKLKINKYNQIYMNNNNKI